MAVVAGLETGTAQEIDREPIRGSLTGASAGGVFFLVGEAIDALVRREYPGSAITYEPGNPAGGLVRLINGEVTLAIAPPVEIAAALAGAPPFPKVYRADELAIVALVVDGMYLHAVGRADFVEKHHISSFGDLMQRRVPLRMSMNQRGNLSVYHQARALINHYGVTEDDIRHRGGAIFYLASEAALSMLRDNKLDVSIISTFVPEHRLLELAATTGVAMIPIEPEAINAVASSFGVETRHIPAGVYDFLDHDYYTTVIGVYLAVRADAPEALTYKLAKALYNNFDYFRSVHPLFRDYDPAMMAKPTLVAFHPGAARFYREVGLTAQAPE